MSPALNNLLDRWHLPGGESASEYAEENPRPQAELFSAGQMERHGRVLAESHELGSERGSDQLLKRLASNEAALIRVRRILADAVRESSDSASRRMAAR